MLVTVNTEKVRERFCKKMKVNGPEWKKLTRNKSLAVGVASMAIYGPALCVKGRTFELWVLNSWVFNFFYHSTPLRGGGGRSEKKYTGIKPVTGEPGHFYVVCTFSPCSPANRYSPSCLSSRTKLDFLH